MAEELSLTITDARDELALIVDAVEGVAEREDWAFDLVFKVNLVLEEVVLNIMDHGFEDGDAKECEIALKSDVDSVTIAISDRGIAFDPFTDAPDADVDSSIDERKVGGLGIHLIETMMDEYNYRRTDGTNRMTLIKFRSDDD